MELGSLFGSITNPQMVVEIGSSPAAKTKRLRYLYKKFKVISEVHESFLVIRLFLSQWILS